MSISVRYTLHCDGCRRVAPGPMGGSSDRQEERRVARKAGWRRVPNRVGRGTTTGEGKDICPLCLPNFPDAK